MASSARALAEHTDRQDNPHGTDAAKAGADPAGSAQSAQDHAVQRDNHSGTQTLATISDAGTAAAANLTTSDTDATAGRVLKVGDFGLGGITPVTSDHVDDYPLGTFLRPGQLEDQEAVARGFPSVRDTPTNPVWWEVHTWGGANSRVVQTATELFVANRDTFTRTCQGTTWQPWKRVYNEGNILGTVSQSGGVPTGAIVERGSNSNGEYVKFADGTVIINTEVGVDVTTTGTQIFDAPVDVSYDTGDFKPVVMVGQSTVVPNEALEFHNIRGVTYFGNPSRLALRIKTAGVSSDPTGSTERLLFTLVGRWY